MMLFQEDNLQINFARFGLVVVVVVVVYFFEKDYLIAKR